MGMTNSRVGYVYLVDEECRIRWAGCADAMKEESEALERCTGVLLGRLENKVPWCSPRVDIGRGRSNVSRSKPKPAISNSTSRACNTVIVE
jgi:hypothetical protein